MALTVVNQSDTLESWRVKTNNIAEITGDLTVIYTSPVASTGVAQNTQPGDVILALNNLEERKVNSISPSVSGTLTVQSHITSTTGNIIASAGNFIATLGSFQGNGSGLTTLNASNLASGTAPTARLGSGTADGTRMLIGDQTWKTASEFGLPTFSDVTDNAISMSIALG